LTDLNALEDYTSEEAVLGPVSAEAQPRRATPMRFAVLQPPFHKMAAEGPASVLTTPSMMSEPERYLLYNLARRYYRGLGRIVDAGIFLGGSTQCFADGLRENERTAGACARFGRPILSLERAIVSPTMPGFFARHGFGQHYVKGDSFADLLGQIIEPHRDLAELRIGDIKEVGAVDAPIEILFLDVLKNAKIAQFAFNEYYPNLIPGRSIVIQQDYFFDGLPFIKVYQEHLGPYFEYLGEVGSSAVFRCIAKVPDAATMALANISPEEQLRLHSTAMQRSLDPSRRLLAALSKARLIFGLSGSEAAADYLRHVESDFSGELGEGVHDRILNAILDTRKFCKLIPAEAG
jgi:hypothetical protein